MSVQAGRICSIIFNRIVLLKILIDCIIYRFQLKLSMVRLIVYPPYKDQSIVLMLIV